MSKKQPKQLRMKDMPPPILKPISLYSSANQPATDKQIDTIIKLRRALRRFNNSDLETITRQSASEQIRMLSGRLKQERKK
jgi:hypothetical protein